MKRYSKQRELVLSSLKKRSDHPTVEMLYHDLKKQASEIGIATIYRNLSVLSEEGKILKLKSMTGGPDRFDGKVEPHIHFECERCKNVYDVFLNQEDMELLDKNMKEVADEIDAIATASLIYITGVCKDC